MSLSTTSTSNHVDHHHHNNAVPRVLPELLTIVTVGLTTFHCTRLVARVRETTPAYSD